MCFSFFGILLFLQQITETIQANESINISVFLWIECLFYVKFFFIFHRVQNQSRDSNMLRAFGEPCTIQAKSNLILCGKIPNLSLMRNLFMLFKTNLNISLVAFLLFVTLTKCWPSLWCSMKQAVLDELESSNRILKTDWKKIPIFSSILSHNVFLFRFSNSIHDDDERWFVRWIFDEIRKKQTCTCITEYRLISECCHQSSGGLNILLNAFHSGFYSIFHEPLIARLLFVGLTFFFFFLFSHFIHIY